MIGLVLLYFAGKAFYDLAGKHGRHQWGYGILGVLSYYGGLILGGILIAVVYELGMEGSIDEVNDTLLSVMAIPIGILVCWGFYKLLESNWGKSQRRNFPDTILDAEPPKSDVS